MTQSRPASGIGRRYGLSVFIGRFSPPHLGHLAVIKQALTVSESTLIAIGSANAARSQHYVPFTAQERETMVRLMLTPEENRRTHFAYIEDQGNMPKWTTLVRKAANAIEPDNSKITLIGHSKDRSSFYLKGFKGWKSVDVENYLALSATTFRNIFFGVEKPVSEAICTSGEWCDGMHPEVADWLLNFASTEEYMRLVEERAAVLENIAKYGEGPFVTGTACVIQGDHVLLVQRNNHPYKGYWALPGGFVERDENVVDAAFRELTEETRLGIKVPEIVLRKSLLRTDYYDNPWRDPRGRIIDFTSLIHLNPVPPSSMTDPKKIEEYLSVPRVVAGDDAAEAEFKAIADVRRDMMAFDHYLQLQNALDFIPREY